MKTIVFTVTNDLSYDQRMERTCSALADHGYRVILVGRKHSKSKDLDKRNFQQHRIPCIFTKGKLFYLEYNFKLLWYLLFAKVDIVCSIDLDTILPGYMASTLRSKKLVYDAHEYFTEMEEIVRRPIIKLAWLQLEKFMLKRIKHAYTISNGYATLFKEKYNRDFTVIRNVPRLKSDTAATHTPNKIIQYQGILNIGRGIEEAIKAVCSLDEYTLRIYGDGPHAEHLKSLAAEYNAGEKVQFMGFVSPQVLREKTMEASIGLTLFSKTGLHHQHSLANRFFDYIHAGIPQIAVGYSEYEAFNKDFEVALLVPELTAMAVRTSILKLSEDQAYYNRLRQNCVTAAKTNNWQKESEKLIAFYNQL